LQLVAVGNAIRVNSVLVVVAIMPVIWSPNWRWQFIMSSNLKLFAMCVLVCVW